MSKNGFTLIEMLIVLSVLSILLFLSLPLQTSLIKKLTEDQFVNQFREDVLLIQNQTSFNSKDRMYIRFYDGYYIVVRGTRTDYARRHFPEGWTYAGSNRLIQFKESGTIIGPRTILMYNDGERIAFTFPFGKGRFYID